ncbi:predicted protein [Verticillium alfalfae VaMs.102]|uniref:Predicted protein n=1 Tax=Verticillium alfalfae (strain VaMs.102 / ATCC MYA-4576 / FGSC 10136) TaxID=526221 RepID=C9SIJ9_VERA1|nr:predicted protein [Verticillium alfalfae VaMs.102]EEY18772.1 predicted protein [Verticillium alfalfae VaMs.102]
MRYSAPTVPLAMGLLLGTVQAMPQAATTSKCSHNNCLRAVTTVTVVDTVDVTTQTLTTTITAVPARKREDGENQEKRQVTEVPSAMPTYATACRSTEAYSSACSCIGISPATITVATPTVKVTSTSTVTAQVTVGVVETVTTVVPTTVRNTESRTQLQSPPRSCSPAPGIALMTQILRAVGGRANGRFAYSWQFESNVASLVQSFGSRGQATVFSLSSPADNSLFVEQHPRLGQLLVSRGAGAFGAVFNADAARRQSDNLVPVTCSISEADWELRCDFQGQRDWYYCNAWMGYVLQIGGVPHPSWGCEAVKLYAERP